MISGEDLAAYAAGEADPALAARVESAVADDASVAARLAAIHDVDARLARWEAPELDVESAARLRAAVDADLAQVLGGHSAELADGPTGAGGVQAAGARPADVGLVDRARAWWRDRVGARGLGAWAGGVAMAAVVLVVGIGVVENVTGVSEDSAADTTMMDAAGSAPGDEAGSGDGFASGGTELAATESAELEAAPEEAASEAMSEVPAAGEGEDQATAGSSAPAALPPIVDDGRGVAALGDIDPAALRDRLEPLVRLLDPTAAPTTAPADDQAEAAAAEEDTATARPLADARVDAVDVDAVAACQPADQVLPIVAEVITLAPGRDVVLYLYEDRVIAVAVEDCTTLTVRMG